MHLKPDYELRVSDWVHLKNGKYDVAIVGIENGQYQGINLKEEKFSFTRSEVKEISDYFPFRFTDKIIFETYNDNRYILHNNYDGWKYYVIFNHDSRHSKAYKTIENARKAALVCLGQIDAENQKKRIKDRENRRMAFTCHSFVVGDKFTGLNGYDGKAWTITSRADYTWDKDYFLIDDEGNKTSVTGTALLNVKLTDPFLEKLRQNYIDLSENDDLNEKTIEGEASGLKIKLIINLREAFNEKIKK